MDEKTNHTSVEKEIDLLDLTSKLLNKKWFIIKVSLIGAIIGLIISFSIPKEYSTTVILTPESNSNNASANGMGALAAMAGINLPQNNQESISPDLYPNIVDSTPFIVSLFGLQVKDEKINVDTNLYTYLQDEQKKPWWGYIVAIPSKLISLFSSQDNKDGNNILKKDIKNSGIISLSPEQSLIMQNLKNRIKISVDKKTGTISLSSIMQSPEISAYIADTVTTYLQTYIINYRTEKARQDLAFTEKLYDETKEDYYKAQQNYATYSDENLDIISARYATRKERLQNEMTLAYSVYNQMAQQLQMAKVKVQNTTPVYTIIQPAVVPNVPDKPNKKFILIGFTMIAFAGACLYLIVKDVFFGNKI